MAEALGIASSIVALVDVSWTIFKYLKDVKEAPKERDSLSTELSGLVLWLNEVKLFTDAAQPNDPWLVTMERLSGPVVQLTRVTQGSQKGVQACTEWYAGKGNQAWYDQGEEPTVGEGHRGDAQSIVEVQKGECGGCAEEDREDQVFDDRRCTA